jgi:4-amino-4-deoxy-L-arabinose transferase-like glycosyltransferase
MAAYVVGSAYVYRLSHLLFASRSAGLLAALAYMLNPNILYMQATAMTEVALNCTVIVAIYYAARWARSFEANDLVKAAAAAAAATLVRYDGWAVAGALTALVVYIAWRHGGRQAAEANAILFGVLAFAGCIGWLVYQQVIFGSALNFLNDPYSAKSQYQRDVARLPTYHNFGLSLHIYAQAVVDTFWLPLVTIAALGLIGWLYRSHVTINPTPPDTRAMRLGGKWVVRLGLPTTIMPVYALLTPFAFNCLSMVVGITGLRTPEIEIGGESTYFNERFALAMAPAVALFLAYVARWRRPILRPILLGILALVLLFCGTNSFFDTPYDLQDPLRGVTAEGRELNPLGGKWLAQHYHGGLVLISGAPFEPLIFYSDLPDQAFITDADAAEFPAALARPENVATWIVMSSRSANYDAVWEALSLRQDWQPYFALRQVIGGTYFYERVGSA